MIEILVVVGLVLANGLFAGAEIAVIAVRATRLAELATQSRAGARLARLREDPERFLATVQIGITVVSATAAAFGGATLAEDLAILLERAGIARPTGDRIALATVVVLVSYLSLVLGELVPKSLALKWSERYALLAARPLVLLGRISAPFVKLLTASSNVILRVFGDRTSFTEAEISRDEVLAVIDRAADAGEVSKRAGDMATRALELEHLHVGSVMIPRAAVATIDLGLTNDELAVILDRTDEERFPVRHGADDVLGYVTARDLARLLAGRVDGGLARIVRPLHVVPESARALDVLEQLQSKRIAIALVVDESGGIEGIVDIDDLAEEVVGSLLVGESRDDASFTADDDGSYVLPASARVHVVNRKLDLDLPTSQRWSTLGGLLVTRLGAVPTVGACAVLDDGTRLEVVETSVRRVLRVRLWPPSTEEEGIDVAAPAGT
jgi:putative hemolysin